MIEIKQKLSTKDVRQATLLHLRPRPAFAILGLILLALLLVGLISSLCSPNRWNTNTLIMIGVTLYSVIVIFVLIPSKATKTFRQNKFFMYTMNCVFDEDGLHTESEINKSDMPWDHFRKFKTGKRMLLLYPSDATYFVFPKHLFTDAEWIKLLDLVKTKLKR